MKEDQKMIKKMMKRTIAVTAACAMTAGLLAGCGSTQTETTGNTTASGTESTTGSTTANTDGGKILFLSSLSSGAYYDYDVAFYEAICAELGYSFQVVYGDSANDPDGNLSQIKNAYTDDVVGLITMMDGGIGAIMEEYPDLYVASLGSSMDTIYSDNATYPDLVNNDHWLGGINESGGDGEDYGKRMAQNVIDYGYKKVSVCIFPAYAYPAQTVAAETFQAEIEAYNATADEPIEIVGDTTVLAFSPLDESFFMEEGKSDLDAIVGFCAGTTFIYPTLVTAKANGTCSADTKLLTGGYDNEEDILADCGDADQTIGLLSVSCPEYTLYPIALIDNALNGNQYSDWAGAEIINPGTLTMHTTEEFQITKTDSPIWDADMSKLAVSLEDMKQYFTRYNESASYQAMVEMIQGITIDSYLNK